MNIAAVAHIPSFAPGGISICAPIPPLPRDIIPGLVPSRGQLIIAGESNVGKTTVALEICSALITGEPLWGVLEPTFRANNVLYLLAEHYDELLMDIWQNHLKLPHTDRLTLRGPMDIGNNKWLVSRGEVNAEAVSKMKQWAAGMDFIVFDPLGAFLSGADAENDNVLVRTLMGVMHDIARSSGAASLILAHRGKSLMDAKGIEHQRVTGAIRGASSAEDSATCVFYMNKTDDPQRFELVKAKYKGKAPDAFNLYRNPETNRHALLEGKRPADEVRKMDARAMLHRFQDANTTYSRDKCIELAATAMCNGNVETMRRWLGER